MEFGFRGFEQNKSTDTSHISKARYTSLGELMKVTLPSGKVIEYINDPLGRRIAKKINGTLVEKYLWQGLTRLLAIYDADDNILIRFEYADSRLPVAMQSGGNTYYLAYDQVGSLRIVTDATGSVIKTLDYDSFGNILSDSNPSFDMPLGFAGGLHDPDTGLVRFGFREYLPEIGRWAAKDPILFEADDTDLYGYCLSDPINWIDPEGLKYAEIGLVGGAIGGFLFTAGASVVVDALTGGWNILATPAELALGTIQGAVIGYTIGATLDWLLDPCMREKGKKNKKYEKPPNPNQRKGADGRQKTGERERNIGHPDGEEHSRRPKGGFLPK